MLLSVLSETLRAAASRLAAAPRVSRSAAGRALKGVTPISPLEGLALLAALLLAALRPGREADDIRGNCPVDHVGTDSFQLFFLP